MDTNKVIFSGRLEFGSSRSFEKVLKLYQHRMENYYKNEIILNWEDVFKEDTHSINVPRYITKATEKYWKNTVNLFQYVAGYAVAGDLSMWMVKDGIVLRHRVIEPESDRAAVQAFLRGRALLHETGKEEEAKKALSKAIEKFERHAKAYERRGYVNYLLGNYEDARYDYNKSININPDSAMGYYGRALVAMQNSDFEEAIADFGISIKKSIPLQPIYWQARRLKADCHLESRDYQAVVGELKFFVKRQFSPENPNYKWRRKAWYDYGRALMELEEFKASAEAFGKALGIEDLAGHIADAELLLYQGMALHEAGQNGFEKYLQEAANKGSKKAAKFLEEVS